MFAVKVQVSAIHVYHFVEVCVVCVHTNKLIGKFGSWIVHNICAYSGLP